ncbi:uncharacterized protein DEA37_0004391, partial [Paragonimus westermani]
HVPEAFPFAGLRGDCDCSYLTSKFENTTTIVYGITDDVYPSNTPNLFACVQRTESGAERLPTRIGWASLVELFTISMQSDGISANPTGDIYSKEDMPLLREEDNSYEAFVLAGLLGDVEGPIQTKPPLLFLDLCLKHTSYNSPTVCTIPISESFETVILYPWKCSRPHPTVVHILSTKIVSLGLFTLAVLSHQGAVIKLRLDEHVGACRLLVLASRPLASLDNE